MLVAASLPHWNAAMPIYDQAPAGARSTAHAARPAKDRDTPAAALGRRILSSAFVRVGPDGLLTIELHDGRALVLRNVAMEAQGYCGQAVADAAGGKRHCGGYAAIAAARPGNDVRTR
ncbi:hypothetical protein ASE78_17790 [Sphingomonas sp. Leaf25]|nr:hypothetical protein ASE78_17790 [Sphingomonas sp. Leaf25]